MALPFEDDEKYHVPQEYETDKNKYVVNAWDNGVPSLFKANEVARDAIEREAEERTNSKPGWRLNLDGEYEDLTYGVLKELLKNVDSEHMMDDLLGSGVLQVVDYASSSTDKPRYRIATREDIEEVPYERPELPASHLDVSTMTKEELEKPFKFPTVNEITDWMVKPGDFISTYDNPFYKMLKEEEEKENPDKTRLENLEKMAVIYGQEAEKNFDEALKYYHDNEQNAVSKYIGDNVDLFDLGTMALLPGATAAGIKFAPYKTAKMFSKLTPKTRLLGDAALQTGLEATHAGIEGENPVYGGLTGLVSTAVPGGVGTFKASRALKKAPNDPEIMEQALGLMRGDKEKIISRKAAPGGVKRSGKYAINAEVTTPKLSPDLQQKIAREVVFPKRKDYSLLTDADINQEINRMFPENLKRGVVGEFDDGMPQEVRLGSRVITPQTTVTPKERLQLPQEWKKIPDEALAAGFSPEPKESFIHDIRSEISKIPGEERWNHTPRKEFSSFRIGKGGMSDVERRIVDELPDREYVSVADVVKALNEFKPANEAERVLKTRLLDTMGSLEFAKGKVKVNRPVMENWEKTVENMTGLGGLYGLYNSPFKQTMMDATRLGENLAYDWIDENVER